MKADILFKKLNDSGMIVKEEDFLDYVDVVKSILAPAGFKTKVNDITAWFTKKIPKGPSETGHFGESNVIFRMSGEIGEVRMGATFSYHMVTSISASGKKITLKEPNLREAKKVLSELISALLDWVEKKGVEPESLELLKESLKGIV